MMSEINGSLKDIAEKPSKIPQIEVNSKVVTVNATDTTASYIR